MQLPALGALGARGPRSRERRGRLADAHQRQRQHEHGRLAVGQLYQLRRCHRRPIEARARRAGALGRVWRSWPGPRPRRRSRAVLGGPGALGRVHRAPWRRWPGADRGPRWAGRIVGPLGERVGPRVAQLAGPAAAARRSRGRARGPVSSVPAPRRRRPGADRGPCSAGRGAGPRVAQLAGPAARWAHRAPTLARHRSRGRSRPGLGRPR
jgi:hypothetical protein